MSNVPLLILCDLLLYVVNTNKESSRWLQREDVYQLQFLGKCTINAVVNLKNGKTGLWMKSYWINKQVLKS